GVHLLAFWLKPTDTGGQSVVGAIIAAHVAGSGAPTAYIIVLLFSCLLSLVVAALSAHAARTSATKLGVLLQLAALFLLIENSVFLLPWIGREVRIELSLATALLSQALAAAGVALSVWISLWFVRRVALALRSAGGPQLGGALLSLLLWSIVGGVAA